MEAHSLKLQSLKVGQNTSIVRSIDHQASMRMQSTDTLYIECNVLIDEFPAVMEIRKTVQQLSFGKAPGTDAIPAEVYKAECYPRQRN